MKFPRIRTIMHGNAFYLNALSVGVWDRLTICLFPSSPSLEAVVCVAVDVDNPFSSTWRFMRRNNSRGSVSLPFTLVCRIHRLCSAEMLRGITSLKAAKSLNGILNHVRSVALKPARRFLSDGGRNQWAAVSHFKKPRLWDDRQVDLSYLTAPECLSLCFYFLFDNYGGTQAPSERAPDMKKLWALRSQSHSSHWQALEGARWVLTNIL